MLIFYIAELDEILIYNGSLCLPTEVRHQFECSEALKDSVDVFLEYDMVYVGNI